MHMQVLNDTLRGAWGFDGYVTADFGALRKLDASPTGDGARCGLVWRASSQKRSET